MSEKTGNRTGVLVIGDINTDITVSAEEEIKKGELQFGSIDISLGGVGRNVALNLGKLGVPTTFLTVVSADPYGKKALKEVNEWGIDMSHSIYLKKEASPTLLYVSDKAGDLHAGIEDLHSLSHLSPDYLKGKASLIDKASWCMISGNLSRESLEYLIEKHPQTHFLFDPASEKMANQVKDIIGSFHTVKPNQEEAEILSNMTIESTDDAKAAVETIRKKGSSQVFLTLEKGGAVYANGEECKVIEVSSIEPVSSTGAGDAFSASLLYCFYHQLELEESVQLAIAASMVTLETKEAVHPDFSIELINQKMKELEFK